MEKYFSNKKEKFNKVTRFVSEEDAIKLEDYDLERTGKTRTRDGEAQVQVLIFEDLEVNIPSDFDEMVGKIGKEKMYKNSIRQEVVEAFQDAVAKVFVDAGIVVKRTEHIKKAISAVVRNVFIAQGGKIDKNGVETSGCTLAGKEYKTMLDLSKVIS